MENQTKTAGDICPSCGKVHGKKINLGITATKEELDSLKLIQNKYSCACQAAQPSAIPDGIAKDKAEAYIASALAVKAEAQWLQQLWWEEVALKYNFKEKAGKANVNIDFSDGSFYIYEEYTKEH